VPPPLRTARDLPEDLRLDERRHARWLRICRLYARWLRARTTGLQHLPADGPVLLVGNHAGLRSLDHMALQAAVTAATGRPVRGLAHRSVAGTPLVETAHVAYAGAVIGEPAVAGRLLEAGEVLAVYPEGGRSTDKPFRDRDRVLPRPAWSDGWVRVAVEHGAAIVPVGFSGFEATVPTVARSRALGRLWGLDGELPVSPQSLVTGTVPFLASLLPFPVRCAVAIGAPVHAEDELGRPPADDLDRGALSTIVRRRVQRLVADARTLRA
jgi:1-acyl-sn-glycerol-3-phosphate acyltransferase